MVVIIEEKIGIQINISAERRRWSYKMTKNFWLVTLRVCKGFVSLNLKTNFRI